MPGRPALGRCVGVDPTEFATAYWSKRPLLSAAEELPNGFVDLFSRAAADELLSRRGLRTPFVRVAKDGTVIDSARYTRPGGVGAQIGDQVADDRILELFQDPGPSLLDATDGAYSMWGD